MVNILIYGMICLGSILMVFNIWGFCRYARFIIKRKTMGNQTVILHIPIILLVFFLLGYIAVGIFGRPDLIVAGILFGGSIFVFVMYLLLNRITMRVIEKERLEAELVAAENSNRAKNSFMASISHEMRTPMNVILGLDDVALKNPDLPDETRDQLEKIGNSGRQMLRLINNILDIQSMENGELRMREAPFSLNAVLEELNGQIGARCAEKGLEYRAGEPGNAAGWYLGDEMLIKQVLMNLLMNAVKFTDAPGSVSFSAAEEPGEDGGAVLRFTVADTGVGMSREFLPRLYEPFAREDASATNPHGGSGLGLTNARNKVRVMGGNISVDSEKGKGTAFTVTIPVKPCEAPQPAEAEAEEEPVTLEGRRILIVEDIEENAEIVADLLDLEGALSDHAGNGQVAVDMFSASPENTYDAILMDLRMPVMDGLEATRRIRALERGDAKTVPIIALTANAFDSDVRQSLDAGMNAHLAKPADSDLLYATLKQWMRRASRNGSEQK